MAGKVKCLKLIDEMNIPTVNHLIYFRKKLILLQKYLKMDDKDIVSKRYLDLRGISCPLNLVRCCLALEQLSFKDELSVILDKGEPEEMVISGLQDKGHQVTIIEREKKWVKLMVVCGD